MTVANRFLKPYAIGGAAYNETRPKIDAAAPFCCACRIEINTVAADLIKKMPRVAAIATMASRIETFQKVLSVIHAQVDQVFVYLDGYTRPPSFLAGFDRISVMRAEDLGNRHASSRFLCLRELRVPTLVVIVDDDIIYPPNYVDALVDALQRFQGAAIVGVHGRIFVPPHQSYINDVITFHFAGKLLRPVHVHELGVGTSAFVSNIFDIDPEVLDNGNMNDIIVATEAQRRGLPRIAVPRTQGWLKAYAETQADSLWARTMRNHTDHSRRMRALLNLYA